MRNLKRALSLGLTAAMISGLMVMGSSAASYADVTSENNVEAIEVLESVGIMIGDESGNFNPDQNVTRNEMAVVMANLMEYNVASYKDTSPFTDVPSWAEPYVAACWTNGITAGYSDTIYGGSDTVTTAQAALMLMKALGYFQYASDFGGDWQLATTRQGNAIDLFTGVDSGVTQAMTRNDVAQLVLNTLRSGTVEASTDGSWTIGDVTINNNVRYSYITSNQDYADAIDDVKSTSNTTDANRYVVELGEQLYQGDLELNDNATDVFGRPARTWSYDSKEIGTYAKTELLKQSYTTKVTGRDLYDLLGSNVVDTYDVKVTIDGVTDHSINGAIFNETAINRNNKAGVGATGNGVLTEVYVDQENKNVDIAIINTYLAIATDDYNEKQEDLTLDVYGIEKAARSDEYVKTLTDGENKSAMEVSNEDFFVEDVLDGDVMLVTVADGEIQSISEPETLSAVEISSFKVGDSLTADGTDYDYANTAEYDVDTLEAWTDGDVINLKDLTYNVYLDQYGYAIGVVEVENPNNYLFITGIDGNYNNLANATYKANAIFLDGTMGVITIDSRKSDFIDDMNTDTTADDKSVLTGHEDDATLNRWFTYTVNSSDVYTVKLVDINAGTDLGQSTEDRSKVIDYKNYTTTDGNGKLVYGNDNTVYLTVSIDDIKTAENRSDVVIDDVDSVAVGIDNVDIRSWTKDDVQKKFAEVANLDKDEVSHGVYTLYDEDGYIIAMVVVGEDNGANDSLVYIHNDTVARESYDKNTEEWTWTRSAVDGLTGEEITLTEVDDSGISLLKGMEENQWHRVRFNADGEVVAVGVSQTPGELDFNDYGEFENWNLNTDPYRYVTKYNNPANAINEAIIDPAVDTVLYHEGFIADMLSNEGHTLYVSQNDDTGIRYTEDTVVVFDQENDNERTTEFYAGESGVERVINELHDVPATVDVDANYVISVLFDNGRATTIVVYDGVPDGDNGNWTETNIAYSEDRKFRLHGNGDSIAETIEYNYTTDRLNYSFYVLGNDDKVVAAGTDVTYDLRVEMNDGAHVDTMTNLHGTTTVGGLISNEFYRAFQEGNEVDIYIENVRLPGDPDEGKVTLSLVGNLIDTKTTPTTVWENATSTVDGEEITGNYGAVNRVEYKVVPGTVVTIVDDDLTAAGLYVLTVGDNTELVDVFAVGTGYGFNYTVTENVTLGGINASALTAVYYGDGIEIAKNPAIVGEDEGVVYLKASTTLNVTVEDDAGTGFIATTDKNAVSASTSTGATAAMTGTVPVTAGTPVYIYAAAQVTPDHVNVYAEKKDDTTVQVLYQEYVAVGTPLTFDPTAGDYVVNGDVSKEDLSNGTEMPAANANFAAAHEVTLTNVEATYSGDTYTGTLYVADGETITLAPATGEGSAVLAVNPDHDVQYGQTNVTSTSVTADAAYVAAVQVKLQTVGTSLRYVDNDNREITIKSAASVGDAIFVECGAELIAVGNTTAANREISLDASTDAEVIQSLKSEGVSGSVTPARLTFTLGSKDTQLTEA